MGMPDRPRTADSGCREIPRRFLNLHRLAGFGIRAAGCHDVRNIAKARETFCRQDRRYDERLQTRKTGDSETAGGRAERSRRAAGRRGFWRCRNVWRSGPDAHPGCAGKAGASLQPVSYDCSLLADARRAAYRPQPSQRRNGRYLRDRHRLSGLQQRDSALGGDGRGGAAVERVQHGHVRQEPPDADVGNQPGRTLRSLAHRLGI